LLYLIATQAQRPYGRLQLCSTTFGEAMDPSVASQADYVIIGAGSAGCVLAARLSENPANRVVLVEAGGKDRNFWFKVPVGYSKTVGDPRYDWGFSAGPEPGLGGRTLYYARGKALGGSSSINGLAWTLGSREDYRRWAELGCTDWDYEDVLPFLKGLESFPEGGADRGKSGPVRVQVNPGLNAASRKFYESCLSYGLPPLPDPNTAEPLGVGRMQTNVGGGVRQSSARAYLVPALGRSNLAVITDAQVDGIVIENGAATGIDVTVAGQSHRIAANREVIVCGGAVGSPLLLEAAGIGDGERLRGLGIDVRTHLPAVGENAADHYFASIKLRLRGIQTLNGSDGGLRAATNGLRYLLTRGGPLSETPTELIGFSRLPGEDHGPAALEFWCNPLTYEYREVRGKLKAVMDKQPGMTASFYPCYPRSKGHVHLGASGRPEIVANYLTDPYDQHVIVEGLRMLRAIIAQPPLSQYVIGETGALAEAGDSTERMLDYARAAGNTGYHLCGTCRMGSDDASVVDQRLRVRGVRRLRVADASVMPAIISTHTNAPAMMIAERAAAFIQQER